MLGEKEKLGEPASRCGISFWDNRNVLELDSDDGCTTHEYTKNHWIAYSCVCVCVCMCVCVAGLCSMQNLSSSTRDDTQALLQWKSQPLDHQEIPLWWLLLNIFPCAYWPLVHLLWRTVYSYPYHFFKMVFLFFLLLLLYH